MSDSDCNIEAHRIKRLVIACDGTWMNTDSRWVIWPSWLSSKKDDVRQPPSNVTRICRAMAHESKKGTEQIIYYQAGVGSSQSWIQRIWGGAFGEGVLENIREAYEFLASNWQPGDEIVLLGFSRGAFTARSIAGLISAVGILTKRGMNYFQMIIHDWENQLDPDYTPRWPSTWDKDTPRATFSDGSYGQLLASQHLTRLKVPIKAVGVWDTVGSLGLPDLGPWQFRKELSFLDTEVSPYVEHAFQALALDEKRAPYCPTVWQTPKEHHDKNHPPPLLKELKQCWFPGAHANIGSGYADASIADLALAWMMAQFQAHDILDFDADYMPEQHEANLAAAQHTSAHRPQAPRPWSLGTIYNSYTPLFWPTGTKLRQPGRNTEPDPATGSFTKIRLRGTNEYIHPSVRIRLAMRGAGLDDRGEWHPEALGDFELRAPGKGPGAGRISSFDTLSDKSERYAWVSRRLDDEVLLWEDKLSFAELDLVRCSPGVWERFGDTL